MANTKIQIKRSTVTSAPATLDIGELAYSYASNTVYIGNSTGTGVIAIGGGYYVDLINAAFTKANNASAQGMDYEYVNTSVLAANAYARVFANSVGVSANAFATATFATIIDAAAAFAAANQAGVVANNANTYGNSTYVKKSGDTISGDLVVQGNLTTSGVVTYANTQTLLIGDALITLNNDIPSDVAPSENAGVEVKRGTLANVSILWNEGSDNWTFTNDGTNYKLFASNTDVESANNYAGFLANTIGSYANTNAANGSYISTGIVKVPFGGTGLTSFTTNGIVYGNNAGDLKVTAAGTDGQVLQSDQGVPKFAMLDGGTF